MTGKSNLAVTISDKNKTLPKYYLDIETTGLNPYYSDIITIQYQELERNTGMPIGNLHILKSWEIGESNVIKRFINDTPILSPRPFDFIPVGMNLKFEHSFLHHKSPGISILDRPNIDLSTIMVLMNYGEFKNSGLNNMIGKNQNGSSIPEWYSNRDYERIENYIVQETQSFLEFFTWACSELPPFHKKFLRKESV